MKHTYKVKLHKMLLLEIFFCALLFIAIARIVLFGYVFFNNYSNGGTFYEFFFPESDLFHLEFPIGVSNIVEFIVSIVLSVLLVYILLCSTFFNRIVVYDEYIKIYCAPRLYGRYILKENIRAFIPVKCEEITFTQKLLNLNFSRKDLYKIVCYNKEFIVTCKDKEQLAQLQQEINIARANKNDVETMGGQKISDWALLYTVFIVIICVLDYIRTFLAF